ncbi:MAG TPA: Gfo/Idh/MocA family oxidoreductase [Terriglobia bacterium]|nr:Gfo/Idh/MocA family oxidoreductase [Terriglobia bacterium]
MRNESISRRDFMRRTSTAAGAALVGKSILLEAENPAASPSPVPPSDTVRFGMVGIGMQGSGLLGTSIRLPGVECVAACDLYDGRHTLANAIIQRETGKTVPATRQYKELLENKDIDCIVAAVPDHWHERIIVDACSAGKDIYCEKPMTHEVSQGFPIIEAANKNQRIVQIGSQRRSSIIYAKAKELIDSGAIGDVRLVEDTMGRNSPCGAWVYPPPPGLSTENLDWETWQGSAPKHPFSPIRFARWRAFRDYGEGIPGDLYVHLLTGIHYIMGVTAPPERAYSQGGLFQWNVDGRDYPDQMSTVYEYPNFRCMIRVTLDNDEDEVVKILGTRGTIEIQGRGLTVSPQDGKDHAPCYYASSFPPKLHAEYVKQWEAEHKTAPGTAQPIEGASYHTPPGYNEDAQHLWNFFQSVRTRRPSVEDPVFGNNTAIGCHLANYSYFHKAEAMWDAGGRTIKGL